MICTSAQVHYECEHIRLPGYCIVHLLKVLSKTLTLLFCSTLEY